MERQLAIAAQGTRGLRKLLEVRENRLGQMLTLEDQDVGDVVNSRGINATGAQQTLEREFDDLLRFAHDIGPTLAIKQGIERGEPRPGAAKVIGSKVDVLHDQHDAEDEVCAGGLTDVRQ